MMKTISGLLKTVFWIFVGALVFHNFTARMLLQAGLAYKLGTGVEVDSARVDFLGSRVTFQDIEIKNPEGFPQGVMARIPKISMDLDIASLGAKTLRFESVEIEASEIRILHQPGGRLNLLALKVFENKSQPRESGAIKVYISNLVLTLGKAVYLDLSRPGSREKVFDLGMRRMVYWNVRELGDIAEIIGWETLKRMGLSSLSGGVLDRIREELGDFFDPPKLLRPAFS